jgi:hypothetical protein
MKNVFERKIKRGKEVKGRQGKERKQLLNDFRKRTRYWKLKEEAVDSTRGKDKNDVKTKDKM